MTTATWFPLIRQQEKLRLEKKKKEKNNTYYGKKKSCSGSVVSGVLLIDIKWRHLLTMPPN